MPTEPVSPEPLLWRDIRGSKTGLARKFNASDADGRFFFRARHFSRTIRTTTILEANNTGATVSLRGNLPTIWSSLELASKYLDIF